MQLHDLSGQVQQLLTSGQSTYGCECWTIKKAEHWRTDAFELWCCRRLLRVPWTAKRSNQSILKELSSEYSLEELMLKLKLQYFGHLMLKSWLIGKDRDAGEDWRQEEKGMTEDEMVGWHHQLNGHGFGWTPGLGDGQGGLVWTGHGISCSWNKQINLLHLNSPLQWPDDWNDSPKVLKVSSLNS